MDWGWVAAIATASGAVIAALKYRHGRTAEEASTLETVVRQRDDALAREARAIEQTQQLHRELEAAAAEIKSLGQRLRLVESMLPWALDALALDDLEAEKAVMDGAAEPWGLSSAVNGGTITYANPAACRAFGLSLDQLLATPWQSLVHPEDLAKITAAEARAMSSGSAKRGHAGRYKFYRDGVHVGWRQLVFFFRPYRNGATRWRARDDGLWQE